MRNLRCICDGRGLRKCDTRTHTLACANTCPRQEHACTHTWARTRTRSRTCTRAHTRKKTPTRPHTQHAQATFAPAHAQRRGARILDIRRSKTGNPHRTSPPCLTSTIYHNLPSKTGWHRHISGCPSRHSLADRALAPHATLREREMRESKNMPRSARRGRTCRPEPADSCAPVVIATSRVAPPATRWPTVHLRHMPH